MIPQATFNKPLFLHLIPIAVLTAFILSIAIRRFNRGLVTRYGKRETLEQHSSLRSRRMRTAFWLTLAVLLLLLALAEPVLPSSSRAVGKAFNFIVVLDDSKSMRAEDYPDETSRIEMARQCLLNLYKAYPRGSAGFVSFTDQANPYMITTDRKVLRYLTLYATVRGEGSHPERGLGAALGLIRDSPQEIRTIVFLSDGGNEDLIGLMETISLLVENGVRVIGVGLGGDEPAKIPNRDPETGEIVGFHRLHGTYALTKLDKRPLTTLAEATDGDYVRIINGDELMQVVTEGNYATDVLLETEEESLAKYPLAAMLGFLLVWVVDKRFFQR